MGTTKMKIWQKRTVLTQEQLFSKPATLLKAAYEYFNWVDENPYLKEQNMVVDKAIKLTTTKHQRPYTWVGLCLYLDLDESHFRWFKSDKHAYTAEWKKVIGHLEKIIYDNKFHGACVGVFNANIISRDLGLIDKQESKNLNLNSVEMSKEEVLKINKQLEDEY